jgi:hypothetical protein
MRESYRSDAIEAAAIIAVIESGQSTELQLAQRTRQAFGNAVATRIKR